MRLSTCGRGSLNRWFHSNWKAKGHVMLILTNQHAAAQTSFRVTSRGYGNLVSPRSRLGVATSLVPSSVFLTAYVTFKLPPLRTVQRSRIRSTKRSWRRPGNEKNRPRLQTCCMRMRLKLILASQACEYYMSIKPLTKI